MWTPSLVRNAPPFFLCSFNSHPPGNRAVHRTPSCLGFSAAYMALSSTVNISGCCDLGVESESSRFLRCLNSEEDQDLEVFLKANCRESSEVGIDLISLQPNV